MLDHDYARYERLPFGQLKYWAEQAGIAIEYHPRRTLMRTVDKQVTILSTNNLRVILHHIFNWTKL